MAEYEAQSEIKTRVKGAPRLYFLNNEELMEFFLKPEFGGEPYRTLIPKCFPGISSFKFGRQANEIVGFVTPSGEMLLFNEIIKISDNIADAIIALAEMMKDALQSLQIRCCSGLIKNPNKTDRWIRTFPAQTLILAGQIYWTSELDKALESWYKSESKKSLKQMRKEYDGVITRLSENLTTNMSLADRQKTTALLTSELFLSKKISDLIKNDWVEPTSLEVSTLMKFYFNEDTAEITIIQMFSSSQYAYQTYEDVYQAVITPETERYIIHITTALNLNKYVAIESSRASGKFETIRCLAKTLGRLVLPYCCSNYSSVDSALMAFEVTAKLGAWAVIKNYLDMNKNVLEEVSYHLSRFLRSMNDNEFDSSVTLNGIPISIQLKPTFFLASTGPNTHGLPASLRAFFRPIAMKGPDTGKISEMLLIAEGFTEALMLSQKV
ncbi:dynein axonemal heavy chain 2-like [Cloeon dipterum]|uniref:dynein axonemal heavy chain 2-like n=1 Tax=Cloeon dipterum TaxID=197152 RepID=UPI00321F8AC9